MTQATAEAEKQQTRSNFEIFLDTINSLKYSQGFYSRLAAEMERIQEENQEEYQEIKDTINRLDKWNNNVDCILYLEQ